MTSSPITTQTLECPKCGKHTIVQHHDGIYQCLNCDFNKDINHQEPTGFGGELLAISMGILLVLLLI
jgi:ribosomal protein S27AE